MHSAVAVAKNKNENAANGFIKQHPTAATIKAAIRRRVTWNVAALPLLHTSAAPAPMVQLNKYPKGKPETNCGTVPYITRKYAITILTHNSTQRQPTSTNRHPQFSISQNKKI